MVRLVLCLAHGRRGRGRQEREGCSEISTNGKHDKRATAEPRKLDMSRQQPYLIRVHFKLPDDLDGDLVVGGGIAGLVDIAKGTIAHLLQ